VSPSRLYASIETLPVRNFYKCVETEDLRWLIKGIDYDHLPVCEVDPVAWDHIWAEFVELSADRDYQIYFETSRKYYRILNHYETLKAEIFTLYFRYNKEYEEDLKAEGITLNIDSRPRYLESLDAAVHRIESLRTKIKLLEKELEGRTKQTVRVEFLDLVNMVEQYRGIPIDIDRMPIKQFVLLINRINDGKRKN
jgi:hypothetical protein